MKKRRGNSRFFVTFVSVIGGVFLLYRLVIYLLSTLNMFVIDEIRFTGYKTINLETLQARTDSLLNKNLYSLKKEKVAGSFADFHRIEEVNISRKFPNSLVITIIERIPVFYVKTTDGTIYPIDKYAVVTPFPENKLKEDMPFVSILLPADSLEFGKTVSDELLDIMLYERKKLIQFVPDFFNCFSEICLEDDKLIFIEANQGYRVMFEITELRATALEYMKLKDTFSFDSKTLVDMRRDGIYRITKMEKR